MGASWTDSPAEVSREVDYLFSMVGYPEDVEEFILSMRYFRISRGTTFY